MRLWLLLALLTSCYQVDLQACLVRCADQTRACPMGLTCGTDDFCHSSEEMLCSELPDGLRDGNADGLFLLDALTPIDGLLPSDGGPTDGDDPCHGYCTGTQVCTAPCNCCCQPGDPDCCLLC